MSYAQQDAPRTPSSAREWKAKSSTPRSGDAFEAESRKVQEAVQKIQRHAGDIRKEANLLSTAPAHGMGKGSERAQAAVREAKSTNDAALVALQGLSRATTGGADGQSLSVEEQNSRKFMHQKLTENLVASMKALDEAFRAYESAEAEALRKRTAESTMATPLVAACSPGLEPSLPSAPDGADLEAGRQSQAQRQEQDVLPAEAEMHAAIAEEYAKDLTNLNQDMRTLQRAMVDLADVTASQGELLDNIEANMAQAAETTEQANEQLVIATQQQRRGTKRFMWLLVIAGSAAAIGALFS